MEKGAESTNPESAATKEPSEPKDGFAGLNRQIKQMQSELLRLSKRLDHHQAWLEGGGKPEGPSPSSFTS